MHELIMCTGSETDKFIVLLHGFGGNHRVWKNQIEVLSRVVNVLAIDLPSHNSENKKLSDMNICIDMIVREILDVLDLYGIRSAVFMGVSLGTVFIKYIEEYYSEYIDSAILVGAIGNVGILLTLSVNVFSIIGDKLPFTFVYRIFSKILMPWKVSRKSRDVFCECAKVLNAKEFKAYMYIFKEHFRFNRKTFLKHEHNENYYISGRGDLCFLKGIIYESKKTNANFIMIKNCGHVANIDKRTEFDTLLLKRLENIGLV